MAFGPEGLPRLAQEEGISLARGEAAEVCLDCLAGGGRGVEVGVVARVAVGGRGDAGAGEEAEDEGGARIGGGGGVAHVEGDVGGGGLRGDAGGGEVE